MIGKSIDFNSVTSRLIPYNRQDKHLDLTKQTKKKTSSGAVLPIFAMNSYIILVLSPTITGLQSLFNICERELEILDMRVNAA
jgi:hypothetical protein